MVSHLRATERHLPYGITQCYLPPDTGERAPPQPQPSRRVLDLPTLERWKAMLTWLYAEMVYLSTDSQLSM